jgi:GNAT superfamily N-acetyltransferase
VRIARFDEVAPTKAQRNAFDCGEPSLDRWLATQAGQSMESRDAVTYLLLDEAPDGEAIAGYFCLAAGSVSREAAPAPMARRAPEPIPAVLMGRFAIDRVFQGQGWGAELLREALLSAASGGRSIGARVMLVDAISDEAYDFYIRFGFTPSPIHARQVLYDLRIVEASAGL